MLIYAGVYIEQAPLINVSLLIAPKSFLFADRGPIRHQATVSSRPSLANPGDCVKQFLIETETFCI